MFAVFKIQAIMTKEQYIEFKERTKEIRSNLAKQESHTREIYIESNKPCEIGQHIEVVNYSGRKIEGIAKGFSIGNDLQVYVDTISPIVGSANVYLSKPHKSLKIK